MATGSGREMVRRAAFYPRRGGGGVFWGWSPAAGGALTAGRLERLGSGGGGERAAGLACEGLRPAAAAVAMIVRVVRVELV